MGFFRRELERLCEAQNHRCCFCTEEMNFEPDSPKRATREHIIPRAFGGSHIWENVVASCVECNERRGPMEAMLFYELISQGLLQEIESRRRYLEKLCQPKSVQRYINEAKTVPEIAWYLFERIEHRGVLI